MALRRRASNNDALNPWPGYVDALSTLLMVIIFVLLVFVLAQAFLSVALSGRDQALDKLNRQVAELTDMLALERSRSAELKLSVAQTERDRQAATAARDLSAQQVTALQSERDRLAAERDGLKTDRDRLSLRLADSGLQAQAAQARAEDVTGQLTEAVRRAEAQGRERDAAVAQLAARAGDIETLRQQLAEAGKRSEAQSQEAATAAAQLAEQLRALTAQRDDLDKQARDAAARAAAEAQARGAAEKAAADEKQQDAAAQAQLLLLSRQLDELRTQLATLQKSLDTADSTARDKDAQIASLGTQLNAALARKVEELQRYRSDFFGKLREVLANRPGIQVVGDRFVFQSEVLFPVGSAELTVAGVEEVFKLAETLKQVSRQIPPSIAWVLRVDGHADRQKIESGRWGSNWELSAGRAITVVKLLIADGVPANRLAATGFGENQPLDPADTPDAYAKNRRIEIRLTDR